VPGTLLASSADDEFAQYTQVNNESDDGAGSDLQADIMVLQDEGTLHPMQLLGLVAVREMLRLIILFERA